MRTLPPLRKECHSPLLLETGVIFEYFALKQNASCLILILQLCRGGEDQAWQYPSKEVRHRIVV